MSRVPAHMQQAFKYGLLREGYNIRDYIIYAAIAKDGYEVVVIDGVQRSGKSNLSLQISKWSKEATLIYKLNGSDYHAFIEAIEIMTPSDYIDSLPRKPGERELWESVLADISFKAGEFVSTMKDVPDRDPKDSHVWDDIAGHYTNMSFRIDPESYAQVDSAFTVIGTKCKTIITNIPNVTRLSRNVKDHVSIEIFVGRNKLRKMMRVFRLPGLKSMDMNLFKIDVEPPTKFDIYDIPKWAWEAYESRRIELAKEVFENLEATVGMDSAPDGYLSIPEAVIMAKDHGADWGVSTIQQNASRGMWKKMKVDGYMFIEETSFVKILEAETYKKS